MMCYLFQQVDPNSCMPFWPQNITDYKHNSDKLFIIRITGTLEASTPLPYYKSRSDLIRLRNKVNNFKNVYWSNYLICNIIKVFNIKLCLQYSAVQVDIQMTEGGTYITFCPYMEGMAPALIINHTENYLKFVEHDLSEYLDEMLVILITYNA